MMKNTLLQPEGWVTPKGYANGVAARGTMVFTGGQIGWNAQQQFESDDFIAQTRQTLLNVRAVLEAGGAGPEHLVRLTWYVTDRNEYNSRLKEWARSTVRCWARTFRPWPACRWRGLWKSARRSRLKQPL